MNTFIKIPAPSFLIALILAAACIIGLLPKAEAVTPAPDGGYPGGNTAEGQAALLALTTGTDNTALGFFSLLHNTTGKLNTAVGAAALLANTADNNTGIGAGALFSNTTGNANTATGSFAMFGNTTGFFNTANGESALSANTIGFKNTANGYFALHSNTTGNFNTAIGQAALNSNTVGNENTATGVEALASNTTGIDNTANGLGALHSNTSGNANTALGLSAGINQTTGSSNVYIGAGVTGVAGESNACYIASIFGQTSANGVPVLINSDNKLGTATSSKRFKEEIKPMDNASDIILALKPVTFRYKKEIDPTHTSQFGLVAEEVEKVNPDLVVRDKHGKPYTVRYDAVNAMLLNEFLKEHRKVQEQEAAINELKFSAAKQATTINELKKEMATVVAHANEHDSKIQKVSDQVQMNSSAARVVTSNH
jgi:hypothetical protein